MKIDLSVAESYAGCKPLYFKYDTQYFPEPAYIYLDGHDIVSADIGTRGCCSRDVFNGLTLAFKIDDLLTFCELEALIDKIKPKLEKICEITEIDWRNSNLKRCALSDKSEEYCRLIEDIEWMCSGNCSENDCCCYSPSCNYCNEDGQLDEDEELDEKEEV